MMFDAMNPPAPTPTGDIGSHVIPELIIAVASVVGFFAVATRILARYMISKLGIPDALLVIAMLFYIGLLYNGYQAAMYPGFGVHTWQFNPKLAVGSHFSFKLGTISFGLGIAFIKIAILIDWMQIFVPTGTRNTLYWILHALIWSNAVFYFIGTFVDAFQCSPREVAIKECNNEVERYIMASGIVNVISDLAITCLPHWVVWKLNMSTKQKRGVSLLFTIGFLATGSALARLLYVGKAYRTRDTLYYSIIINIWAIAEQTFGFLILGVPAIPKAFHGFKWASSFGSHAPSRPGQSLNQSDHCERGATWPVSSPRRRRDPWDTDSYTLGIDEEAAYIPLPDQAYVREDHERRNDSRGGTGTTTVP
ncbi:hypothetical protein E0Z10_g5482 [Xylaria hypoxylon]|uniref:Rhodopsin domain-containing protein n=1 Tax=Xylaria hypoxylon TaxID=37992 RepID=A0A4Z0YH20_9PEZI|nr:hypothetical protein E0Z10_g5482 [Xylaria hypoxylon]